MEKIKYIGIVFAFNYLLSACGFISQTRANISQNANQEKTNIENLPNGNYRYCSDPNPYSEDEPDVHRYCFTFTKTGNKVVGVYLYRVPKDTPSICIEGMVKDNLVNGLGYENIGPGSKPYTEEDFSGLNELSQNQPLSYWDDEKLFQGGLNLKVDNPSLYELSPPSEDKYASYWATIRYENAQIDLNNFEQIEVGSLPQFSRCTNR